MARRNLQVFIEMLPQDPSISIIEPLLSLLTDLRLLERRMRSEARSADQGRLRILARKSSIMVRATSILNERYNRDMIDAPSKELNRMRLFSAEIDADLTSVLGGGE
jgi:hypothetical protein